MKDFKKVEFQIVHNKLSPVMRTHQVYKLEIVINTGNQPNEDKIQYQLQHLLP